MATLTPSPFFSPFGRSWSRLLPGLALALILPALGCGGGADPARPAIPGPPSQVFKIVPAGAILTSGEAVQFATDPPYPRLAWTVQPPSAGTIAPDGTFIPAGPPGQCTILATLTLNVAYTASATVIVLAPPPPATSSPDRAQLAGGTQTGSGGRFRNQVVIGGPIPVQTAASADGTIVLRHGFYPRVPPPAP